MRHRKFTPRKKDLLLPGNDHLGPHIWTWSIPAELTCPGATFVCLLVCYALRFLFKMNLARHMANWVRAQDTDQFAKDLIAEIRYKQCAIVRIHVAGDFFSAPYIRAWTRVATACKRTRFLFYTRSWRVPELVPDLVQLATLTNCYAWWSEDRDTGPCRLLPGRRCYMAVDEEDEANVPDDVDLVFRVKDRKPRKWVGSVWVCAKEQGIPNGVTCSKCFQCYLPGAMPRLFNLADPLVIGPDGRYLPAALPQRKDGVTIPVDTTQAGAPRHGTTRPRTAKAGRS